MLKVISLDIETLSTHKNAVVASIGAVALTKDEILPGHFEVRLDLQEQIDMGRHVSEDTLKFWFEQESGVRRSTFSGHTATVEQAIDRLRAWILSQKAVAVLTKGPAFDAAIIESLCEDYGFASPFSYRTNLDVRTIEFMFDNVSDDVVLQEYFEMRANARMALGAARHDAVADAIEQGRTVQFLLRKLAGE